MDAGPIDLATVLGTAAVECGVSREALTDTVLYPSLTPARHKPEIRESRANT